MMKKLIKIFNIQIILTHILKFSILIFVTIPLVSQETAVGDQTVEDAEHLVSRTQKLSNSYFEKGKRFYMIGNYDGAMFYFQKAVDINPNHSEALNYFGGAHFHLQEYDKAIEYYTKSLDINSNAYWVLHNKGKANHHKGEYSEAIENYSQSLSIKNDFYRSLYYRAVAQVESGNIDAAYDDLAAAIMHQPNDHKAWYLFGLVQFQKGEIDDARNSFTRSLSLSSASLPFYSEGKNPYAVNEKEFQLSAASQTASEERARSN
jgi:tetratricopeptide (TPR) repeat protein